jgi:hypothetical protein
MRKGLFTAFLIASVLTRLVADACPDVSDAAVFVRTHPVGNFRNEPVESGIDTLRIWTDDTGTLQFCLETYGTNFHQCEVSGPLTRGQSGRLTYRDPETTCSLDLMPHSKGMTVVVSREWERFGRCHSYCGQYASVESGLFVRR